MYEKQIFWGGKRLLGIGLALVMTLLPMTGRTVYAADSANNNSITGYTSYGNMAYRSDAGNGYDFKGKVDGEWQQVTYYCDGFTANVYNGGENLSVSGDPQFIADGKAVKVDYTVTNTGSDAISNYRFFIAADTAISGKDASTNTISDGTVIMTSGNVSFFALSTTGGSSPVATEYSSSTGVSYYNVVYQKADPSTVTSVNTADDSAFVMYFPTETIAAGESKTYTMIVGMGSASDINDIISKVKESLNVSTDYTNEMLTDLVANGTYEITVDSTVYTFTTSADGTIPLTGKDANGTDYNFIGKTISVVRKGDGTTTKDSDAKSIDIADRPDTPDAPETLTNTPVDIDKDDVTTTADSITIKAVEGQEYRLDDGTWIKPDENGNVVFNGLVNLSNHKVYTRVSATQNTPASLSSDGASIKTMGMFSQSDITKNEYTGTFDGLSHEVSVSTSVEGATITYCDTQDGTYRSEPYSFKNAGENTVYYCVSKDGYYNSYGTLSANIAQASLAEIAAPTLKSSTDTSVTLNSVTANGAIVKYAVSTTNEAPTDEDAWQTDTTFNGLTGGSIYYFFAKCDDSNYEGTVISTPLTVTTPIKQTSSGTQDLANNTIKDLEPGETYEITVDGKTYKFVAPENGTIPMSGKDADGNAYDFFGKKISIVHKGDGTTTTDSDPITLDIKARATTPSTSDNLAKNDATQNSGKTATTNSSAANNSTQNNAGNTESTTAPNTGDANNIGYVCMLMSIAGACAIGCAVLLRRKEYN